MGDLNFGDRKQHLPPEHVAMGIHANSDALTAASVLNAPTGEDNIFKKAGRVAEVTAVGTLGYALPGAWNAAVDDITNHPLRLAGKVVAGVAIGAVMKTFLPAKGAVRAMAGTVMLGAAAMDLAKPVGESWSTAIHKRDDASLTDASKKLGAGVGSFVWDSAVGMGGGIAGEYAAGRGLRAAGATKYSAWETGKETFFEKREGMLGQFVAPTREALSGAFRNTKEYLNPTPVEHHLPAAEALARANDAAKKIQDETVHKYLYKTPLFSQYIDGLIGKGPEIEVPEFKFHDLAESNRAVMLAMASKRIPDYPVETVPVDAAVDNFHKPGGPGDPDAPRHEGEGTPKGNEPAAQPPREGEQVPPAGADKQPPPEHHDPADGEVTIGAIPTGDRAQQPFVPREIKATSTAADELHPDVLNSLALEAKSRQDKWALSKEDEEKGMPSQAAIADFRDQMLAPIKDTTDATRKGALLPPEYKQSSGDLEALLGQIENAQGLQEAGPIVRWHSMATSQRILNNRDVMALNALAREMHGDLLKETRRLGVKDNILEKTQPSLVTITEDGGSGNFTIPRIEEVLRRAITIFPRNQSELVPVFGPINYHENLGHDDTYPMIALIADRVAGAGDKMNEDFRNDVLLKAVKNAFDQNHIEDGTYKVGTQDVKKSLVFAKMLIAEANENTADMIGTAASGLGTPLSLGTLLQSLREGGQLENRNVFGRRFPDVFEPHGFDRWRVKLAAEVMRHLGKGDAKVNEFADGLDVYADKASRPGDSYVFANIDNRGQKIEIPYREWDAIIPHIVKTQFDTPLPALETPSGRKTLADVVPNFVDMFHKTDELATKIADTVVQGKTRFDNFDADTFRQNYTIGNVFNANLLGWVRATARGAEPDKSLNTIRGLWENLRELYLENNPHDVPLTPGTLDKMRRDPLGTVRDAVVHTTGNFVGAVPDRVSTFGRMAPAFGGAAGAIYLPNRVEDLMDMHQKTKEIVGDQATLSTAPKQNPSNLDLLQNAPVRDALSHAIRL